VNRLDTEIPRAFLTCAARAVPAVAPLVEEAERLLLDSGWRTRVPQRAVPRDGTTLEERRRLRRGSYEEVERAHVVVHIPAPLRFSGSKFHRELQHAMRFGIPIALLLAVPDRRRLGVGDPSSERVRELAAETGATSIESLSDMPRILEAIRSQRARVRGTPA
jgi:hypothetical protein